MGLTFGIGGADHRRFSASLKGIAGASSLEGFTLDIWGKYYLALGRFVDTFASVEDSLFIALCATAKLDAKTGAAVFSGAAVDGSISFIRRLHETRNEPIPPRLGEVLAQLSAINTTRNAILHHGAHPVEDGTLRVTDQLRAHTDKKARSIPISPEVLDVMTEDVVTIVTALAVYTVKTNSPEMYEASAGPNRDAIDRRAMRALLYTPAQPSTKGQQSQSATQKPKPPPSPSPA